VLRQPAMKQATLEALERNNKRLGLTTVEELCEKKTNDKGEIEYLVKWQVSLLFISNIYEFRECVNLFF
jgi:hypothetical protein